MVERFFRDLTENRLRRGVFRSVLELIQALDDFLDKQYGTTNLNEIIGPLPGGEPSGCRD